MSAPLSETEFRKQLSTASQERLQELLMIGEIDSTNAYLQRFGDPAIGKAHVCLADQQTAGRGRQGKTWKSIFGGSLLYSISWMFNEMPKDFSALTLAVGVEVKETLDDLGFVGAQLKWPNDLLVGEAKLGGILVEVAQRQDGIHMVCGIGLNVLQGVDPAGIEHKVAVLEDLLATKTGAKDLLSRNLLAAKLTDRLVALFRLYPKHGFPLWRPRWQAAHAFAREKVQVITPEKNLKGIALGVDEGGAFLLQTDSQIERFISNDVSVRRLTN